MYELVGVLIHTGSSANAGHYTAHLRDSSAKKEWWKFDDDHVSRLNPKELGETLADADQCPASCMPLTTPWMAAVVSRWPASNHMPTDSFGASCCQPSS